MRKLYNFFNSLFLFSLTFLSSNITFAQNDSSIKRQYVDTISTATTVVIKSNQANDFAILNNQFNHVGMNGQIFIKTENQNPAKPKSQRTSFEDVIKETSKSTSIIAKSSNPKKRGAAPKAKPIPKKQSTKKITPQETKKTSSLQPAQSQKYFGVGVSRKLKTKKKRVTKRKRVKKRKRSRCFQF